MKVSTLAFFTVAAAAPLPAPQLEGLAALLPPGLDLGALASQFLGGGAGAAPGAAGAAPGAAGGFDFSALAGLASSFLGGGGGPEGDANVIITAYNAIKEKSQAMDVVVEKYNKDTDLVKEKAVLEKLTKDLLEALESSTTKIAAMVGPIGIMGATGLAGPGGEVTEATKLSIQHLIDRKDIFKGESKKAELDALKSLLSATEKFNAAVNAKLPSLVQGIASPQAQQSVDVLQQAVTAFS
jgi:hypothetical protein